SLGRGNAVLDAHQGHPMPLQGDAAGGGGKNLSLSANRRPGLRREPALLAQARRIFGVGSADRVDRQNRLQSDCVPVSLLADDVSVCSVDSVDLFAQALSMATPVASAGRLNLRESARTAAESGTWAK